MIYIYIYIIYIYLTPFHISRALVNGTWTYVHTHMITNIHVGIQSDTYIYEVAMAQNNKAQMWPPGNSIHVVINMYMYNI